MVKTCLGTPKFKGCGKTKPDTDFSLSYKDMCKECANQLRRNGYQYKKDKYPQTAGTAIYNEFALKPWR